MPGAKGMLSLPRAQPNPKRNAFERARSESATQPFDADLPLNAKAGLLPS